MKKIISDDPGYESCPENLLNKNLEILKSAYENGGRDWGKK